MTLRALALATACAAAFAGAASAQTVASQFDRVVVFGDSLSDVGNLPPGAAPPPPYFGGRVTNGPVYAELLGFGPIGKFGQTTGSVSYAFGGARADTAVAQPPGLPAQFATYRQLGGTFGPRNLAIVWGGANDIFQAFPAAAASADPQTALGTAATVAARTIDGLVGQVAAAGATTIAVGNYPDFGATPQFRNLGPGAALATFGTNTFNQQLNAALTARAATTPGANIVLVDTNRAFAALIANPSRFGLTNVTQTCFTGTSVCASPSTFLFWDGVHPTAVGHALTAAVYTDYLTYQQRGAAASLLSEGALDARARSFDASFERLTWRDLPESGFLLTVDGAQQEADARGFVGESETSTLSVRGAGELALGDNKLFGVAISYSKADTDTPLYDVNVETLAADAYYGWRGERLFVNVAVGGGFDSYPTIKRVTALGPVTHTAESDGFTIGAEAQAGLFFDLGNGATLAPRVGLGAARASVDGYREEGSMARHEVSEHEVTAITAEAVLRLEAPLGGLKGFVEGGWRDTLDYDAEELTVGLVDNPARDLPAALDELAGGAVVNAGLSGEVGERWTISASYRGRAGDDFDSHQGRVSVAMKF